MRRPPQPSRRLLAALALALAAAGCSGASPPPPAPPECTGAASCDDANACTADACTDGRCTHLPEPKDTLCSANAGQVCDGAGTCVACNRDAQCAGTSPATECQHPACTAGHGCAPAFVDAGTVTSTQVAGDCRRTECDGAGATRSAAADTDLPVDGNECTSDVCTAGVPTNPPRTGTACGPGGAFQCTESGHCGCETPADCTAPATCGGGGTAGVCGCTPTTCGGAGQTCGSSPNGCGGTLSCDSGTKDGGETDVDCGGSVPACARRCAQGQACLAGTDCLTGSCVDGVCCDTACDGACQACSRAKKADGQDGVCGAIAAGLDPDAECTAQGVASCGMDGTCAGNGACQLYPASTVCGAASCSAGAQTAQSTCDGAGTCLPGATTSCGGYACGVTSCLPSCARDLDCASTHYCSVGTGQCLAKKAQGAICGGSSECQGGSCADGFCCDTACAGACRACSAAKKGAGPDGVCGVVAAGTDPDAECPYTSPCAPGYCSAGFCQIAAAGVLCATQGCSGDLLTLQATCNGASEICPVTTIDCAASGQICAGGACVTP